MAQDNSQEKSHQPTEKRKRDARSEGQIARSRELNTFGLMLASILGVWLFSSFVFKNIFEITEHSLSLNLNDIALPMDLATRFFSAVMSATFSLLPFFALILLAIIISNVVMGGVSFNWGNISFKWEKLNLFSGMMRLFSKKNFLEAPKSLAKFFLILGVSLFFLGTNLRSIYELGAHSPHDSITLALTWMLKGFSIIGFSLFIIALIDVPLQWFFHQQKMKMTSQELRDEMKDVEGRPEVKQKIRTQQRKWAQTRMMQQLPMADVVITNPTHYAVALKYDQSKFKAPYLIAKGRDQVAARIRQVALEEKIPTISLPPLARAVYTHTELNQPIPEGLFKAIAQVLAYVYQLKRLTTPRERRSLSLGAIDIPRELRVE